MVKRLPASCLTLLVVSGLFAGGCSRFSGEWIEEGRYARDGEFRPAEGPRRMALSFEPLCTVRYGSFVDAAGVVDAKGMAAGSYFTMQNDRVAQLGSMIARVEGNRMTTYIGAEKAIQFVKRRRGPDVFPPHVTPDGTTSGY